MPCIPCTNLGNLGYVVRLGGHQLRVAREIHTLLQFALVHLCSVGILPLKPSMFGYVCMNQIPSHTISLYRLPGEQACCSDQQKQKHVSFGAAAWTVSGAW